MEGEDSENEAGDQKNEELEDGGVDDLSNDG